MPRAPRFWDYGHSTVTGALAAFSLSPFAALTTVLTRRRVARSGFAAPVPVLCCGNLTLGGTGKTILVRDLAGRLKERGIAVHILTRGYGGRARGPLRVDPRCSASLVGDEPLLLAEVAPVWVGADRARSAHAALAAGAEVLLMDDGLQNPTLAKSFSFLVLDGGSGFGNGRVFPAGPLREPIADGLRRVQAAVLIGEDRTGARRRLPTGLPVLGARLVAGPEAERLAGSRVIAFAGIGRPAKFFASLEGVGAVVLARCAFPDHHRYRAAELARLLARAERENAVLVTTAKDRVRLPMPLRERIAILSVHLVWDEPSQISGLIESLCPRARR